MTDNYTDSIIKAITEKSNGDEDVLDPCIVCGNTKWDVAIHMGHLPAHKGGAYLIPLVNMVNSFPLAVVICSNCGYTLIFNLIQLGIDESLFTWHTNTEKTNTEKVSWWNRFKQKLGI